MEQTATNIVNITIILGLISVLAQIVTIFWFLHLYNRKSEFLKKEKDLIILQGEKKILEERISAQESSFTAIGKEIHDNVIQLLSLIKMNMAVLKVVPEPQNENHYNELKDLTLMAIKALTSISKSLNPSIVLEFGLDIMIKEEIKRISTSCSTVVTCNSNFELNSLNKKYQLEIFRIFQEAIRNSIQHGNSKNIDIECIKEKEHTTINVVDDGSGFMLTYKDKNKMSQGLINMKSRCLNASGIFGIQSEPGKGTKIHMEFPTKELFKT